MRILFIIKSLAFSGGGAERIISVIASALAQRGHEVTLLTYDAVHTEDFYDLAGEVQRVRLGAGEVLKKSGPIVTLRRLIGIRASAVSLRPDVVVGFMHSAFIPARLALLGTGVPVVGSERTSYQHYSDRPIQRMLLRATVPHLTYLTVNGEEVREGFPKGIAAKMAVVPNPVASTEARADPVGQEVKTLLSIGRLRPEKDHLTLLDSFARIAHLFPDWRLRIIGDGPLRDRLVDRAAGLGLSDRVQIPGATTSVGAEYLNAQLFVLPSLYEAFPNCVAEALACGLPVVGFKECPGTNALIVPGVNGELAAGSDRVEALSDALTRLMSSASLRQALGRAAPSTVDRYSTAAVVNQWEQLLRRAINNRATEISG